MNKRIYMSLSLPTHKHENLHKVESKYLTVW
jgi:hypothetical protein